MQQIDRVTAMARQAAQLLPEPPDDRDIDGYLAWTELVWTTAMRLSVIAGTCLGEDPAHSLDVDLDAPVTARRLMDLARIAQLEWQQVPAAADAARRPTATAAGPVIAPPVALPSVTRHTVGGDSCGTARRVLGARARRRGRPAGGAPTRDH